MGKGARSVLTKIVRKVINPLGGTATNVEKDLVARFVQDRPSEMTTTEVNALARVLRHSKEYTLKLIEEARETLVDSSKRYVQIHREAVEAALANPTDPKSLEVAIKGTQWAMENISGEGARIVDKKTADSGTGGTKVYIGVKVGGGREQPAIGVEVK